MKISFVVCELRAMLQCPPRLVSLVEWNISMALLAPELHPPVRLLMGPGPSDTHPRVLEALAKGTVGHLDPYYLEVMNGLQRMLRDLFRTKNQMTFAVSGTGSAGMEAAVVNLIEPGDSMIVCVNGVFGARMVDVAERSLYGLDAGSAGDLERCISMPKRLRTD